jgi:cytochrome c peroxidase
MKMPVMVTAIIVALAPAPVSELLNTGMADPSALVQAFDRFRSGMSGATGTRFLDISLLNLRGIASEAVNASGSVRIDFDSGSVTSRVNGLPQAGAFDLWLVDNRPASRHTTLAEPADSMVRVGTYTVAGGSHTLSLVLGRESFVDFFPDRGFVVRSDSSPVISFVLTGSSTFFDRLIRRQVRFLDDSGAATGFDALQPVPRDSDFTKLISQGRRLFLNEKFDGNGRACGTCHIESNNFTIDPEFISRLSRNNPLFVAENNPALAALERSDLLRTFGLILVNADGFGNPEKFTLRATQNVQALANSMVRPDPSFGIDSTSNGRNADPPQRLGWGNDGAPLRDFSIVAIAQHATKTLDRRPGTDFRVPTDEELDALVAYQLPLGRQEDFNLQTLELKSALASSGKTLFLDTGFIGEPGHKNCNACHFNAGGTTAAAGNPMIPGFPRLDGSPRGFNMTSATNTNETPLALTLGLPRDGGFGLVPLPTGGFGNFFVIPGFGDFPVEEFNSATLVESADTGPFFHNHTVETLEEAVAFYGTPAFQSAPFSIGSPGGPVPVGISSDSNDPEVQAISAFLRVLNALENIRSSINVAERGRRMQKEQDARELAELALAETMDAAEVLSRGALSKSREASVLSARAHLAVAGLALEIGRRLPSLSLIEKALAQAVLQLQSARSALANPSTLPVSYRN